MHVPPGRVGEQLRGRVVARARVRAAFDLRRRRRQDGVQLRSQGDHTPSAPPSTLVRAEGTRVGALRPVWRYRPYIFSVGTTGGVLNRGRRFIGRKSFDL